MATQGNTEKVIDSRFFVPPGVVDMRQANSSDSSLAYDPDGGMVEELADSIEATPSAITPMPPTSYAIVDQRVKIAADGSAFVDVWLEFPDTPGVESIDIRITKA